MVGRANLQLLKDAALRRDWKGASDAYLELVWTIDDSGEQRDLSPLEWALRLRKAENVAAIVDEMLANHPGAAAP